MCLHESNINIQKDFGYSRLEKILFQKWLKKGVTCRSLGQTQKSIPKINKMLGVRVRVFHFKLFKKIKKF
jgi:hypothetical protein